MKEELKIKVGEVLNLLDLLLAKERTSAYHTIRRKYVAFLDVINKKDKLEETDFFIIMNCMRMFLEAPPNNYELDMRLLLKMDEIYKLEVLIKSDILSK